MSDNARKSVAILGEEIEIRSKDVAVRGVLLSTDLTSKVYISETILKAKRKMGLTID